MLELFIEIDSDKHWVCILGFKYKRSIYNII